MRILASIILLLLSPGLLQGQEETKYMLDLKDKHLEVAIKQLASLGDIELSYVREVIPDVIVDESWYNATAEEMLLDLLDRHDLVGERDGQTLLIYPKPPPSASSLKTKLYYGRITDIHTGEYIVNAYIHAPSGRFVLTDNYGLYAIELVKDIDSLLVVKYLGYHTASLELAYIEDPRIDIALFPSTKVLAPVIITQGEDDDRLIVPDEDLIQKKAHNNNRTIDGSNDIIDQLASLPGVVKMSEGRSGYSVHGTSTDQQLILIDDAPVFNPTHALGFLSLFSTDAMNSATFLKSGISSRFGGRTGSILDIRLREGNTRSWNTILTTSPYTSSLMLEGPIIEERLTLLLGGRISHLNHILNRVDPVPGFYIPDEINFNDFIGKLNYTIGDNHRIFFSGFANRDVIQPLQPNETEFLLYDTEWRNRTLTARWNAIWSDRLFSNASLVYSDYNYEKRSSVPEVGISYQESSNIDNRNLRFEVGYHLSPSQRLLAGIDALTYRFDPASGFISLNNGESQINYDIDQLRSNEISAYAEDEVHFSPRLVARLGLRYTAFSNMGNDAYEVSFDENGQIIDSTFHKKGEVIRTFYDLQPRVQLDYELRDGLHIQIAYNRSSQYIFRLLSEQPASPNEYWLPAGANIRPMVSDALFADLSWRLSAKSQASIGAFYRTSDGVTTFRNGANILFSESLIDRQVTQGEFRSIGMDFELSKQGEDGYYRLSYALMDAEERYDDINDGQYFDAANNFNHDLNVQAGLNMSKRAKLNANWTWRSGDLVSLPSGFGSFQGFSFPIFRSRNNFRLPSYQRLDLSVDWILLARKPFNMTLTAGVYNLLGRHNPYQVRFSRDIANPQLEVLALTRAVPFVNLRLARL